MKNKCKVCEPEIVSVVWEKDEKDFVRTMLRECRVCHVGYTTLLHYVDPDFPTCGACLSQNLFRKDIETDPKLVCEDCGSMNILQLTVPV